MEIGIQQELRRLTTEQRETTIFAPFLVRVGLTEHLEARLETNSVTSSRTTSAGDPAVHETGYSPVSLGAKYEIFDSGGDNRRSFGLIGRLFPPTGSSRFRNDRSTGDVRLAADWDFAPKLSLNPNLGFGIEEGQEGHTFGALLGALTLNFLPTDRINPFVDAGLQSPQERKGATAITLDAGLAYIIGKNFQLDLSAGRGVRGTTPPKPFTALGVSIRR